MTTKTKAHTRYKLANGDTVPSVTTVLGILGKPALIHWAWELGTKGQDYRKVRDEAADIGTLAHYLIMCHLRNQKPDTTEYSASDIDKAETCLIKYWDWEKAHNLEPILVETSLVSEEYKFGGTIDCYGLVDGELVLLDFKTGKAIYPEHFYQLAAYQWLIRDTPGYATPLKCIILRIGRDENEGFEPRFMTNLGKEWTLFLHCLEIYKLQKEVRREK